MIVAISGLWHLVPHHILHRTRGFLTNRRVSDPLWQNTSQLLAKFSRPLCLATLSPAQCVRTFWRTRVMLANFYSNFAAVIGTPYFGRHITARSADDSPYSFSGHTCNGAGCARSPLSGSKGREWRRTSRGYFIPVRGN